MVDTQETSLYSDGHEHCSAAGHPSIITHVPTRSNTLIGLAYRLAYLFEVSNLVYTDTQRLSLAIRSSPSFRFRVDLARNSPVLNCKFPRQTPGYFISRMRICVSSHRPSVTLSGFRLPSLIQQLSFQSKYSGTNS